MNFFLFLKRQYYTLGEIFKAYGHYSESILHLKHALELHPTHEPIKKALRECENGPVSSVHSYTVIIIVCLVSYINSRHYIQLIKLYS